MQHHMLLPYRIGGASRMIVQKDMILSLLEVQSLVNCLHSSDSITDVDTERKRNFKTRVCFEQRRRSSCCCRYFLR